MNVLDKLGFGPKRYITKNGDDRYTIHVVPSKLAGALPTQTVHVTADQLDRFQLWLKGGVVLIQDALPDLSAADREIILTGLGNDDFHRATKDD